MPIMNTLLITILLKKMNSFVSVIYRLLKYRTLISRETQESITETR